MRPFADHPSRHRFASSAPNPSSSAPSGPRHPILLALLVALLISLPISSSFAYYAFATSPAYSAAKAFPFPSSSFSVSPSYLSSDYDHGILSFMANSALNASLAAPPSLPSLPASSRAEVNFSIYWGYLFRWNFSVSPGYVNGSRVFVYVVPSGGAPSTSGTLIAGGKRVGEVNGSALLHFLFSKGEVKLVEGNSTLAAWRAPAFTPSPLVVLRAERGAMVLLDMN
ncbi:MAG: hypothetical protein ACP5VF_13515, partial [Acidobacteriota bacterium]